VVSWLLPLTLLTLLTPLTPLTLPDAMNRVSTLLLTLPTSPTPITIDFNIQLVQSLAAVVENWIQKLW
jgi:hypothetical protein